jgi:hypothetical protein
MHLARAFSSPHYCPPKPPSLSLNGNKIELQIGLPGHKTTAAWTDEGGRRERALDDQGDGERSCCS